MNEAHCWELDRLRHRLQAEEFGHQNFPLIQAIEAAIAALHGSEAGPPDSLETMRAAHARAEAGPQEAREDKLLSEKIALDEPYLHHLREAAFGWATEDPSYEMAPERRAVIVMSRNIICLVDELRKLRAGSEAGVSARVLEWQDISTAPADSEVFFWVVPKTPEESYCNSSGDPIFSTHPPRLHRGRLKTWSALEKATHWMPLLTPPSAPAPLPAPTGGPMTDARRTAEDRLRDLVEQMRGVLCMRIPDAGKVGMMAALVDELSALIAAGLSEAPAPQEKKS